MNAQLKSLESLLKRVQDNARAPRGAPLPEPPRAPAEPFELDEPGVALGQSVPPDSLDATLESHRPAPVNFAPSTAPGVSIVSLDSEPPPAPAGFPGGRGPTMEQLGQTVALEEGPHVALEVEKPAQKPASDLPPSTRGLEAAIPSQRPAPLELEAPPEARADLERIRLGQTHELVVEAHARPTISTNVVELVTAQRDFQPRSFAKLLEASLKL
jgi:hypothetical protein